MGAVATARRQLSDEPQEEDDAIVFNMNDKLDARAADGQTPPAAKQQLVENDRRPGSSRRTESPSSDNSNALHAATEKQTDVRSASGSRSASPNTKLEREVVTPEIEYAAVDRDMNWEDHIREALYQLKETDDKAASPEMQVRYAAIMRMLNVAVGDLESAMEPIEGLQANEQDYFRHQFKALHDALDPAGNPVPSRRWSLTMISQRKALEHLAAASDLQVNNTAFCTNVQGFGNVSKFPEYNFKPDQELLLYCELDNFVSESLKSGYETQLQGRYEIVDANGRRLADQVLPMDSHVCSNQRRDYFIAYRIYMPKEVAAGRHKLKLTIEDMKGRKFGHSELDFQIIN